MWRLRQHLLTHKNSLTTRRSYFGSAAPAGTSANPTAGVTRDVVELSSPLDEQQARGPTIGGEKDDHDYYATADKPSAVAADSPPVDVSTTKKSRISVSSKAAHVTNSRCSDHLYSARRLSKKEAAALAAKKEQQIQLKKRDHLYSSTPSSPTSATAAASSAKPSSRQSIQALGHSYAAAARGVNGKGMFPCDQCEKIFPQPYRLNRHIREVHIKERSHFCRHCDKAFFKLTSRERHEMTHTEHDKWKCTNCEKCFRDQSSLKYHLDKRVCLNRLRLRPTR